MGRLRPVYYKWVQFIILGLVISYLGVRSLEGAQFKSYLPECRNTQSTSKVCMDDAFETLKGQRNFAMGILTIGLIVTGISTRSFYKAYRKSNTAPMNYDQYTR